MPEDQDNRNAMLAKATADSMMFQEKAEALEKQVNKLTPQIITGNQLVQAQELRKDNTKTKADIAALIGVDHQALADLLGGVDTIIAKETAGTYSEQQYKSVLEAGASLQQQYDELKAANDETVRSLQEKSDMLSQLQLNQSQPFPADTKSES